MSDMRSSVEKRKLVVFAFVRIGLFALVLIAAVGVHAAGIDDYRSRIAEARESLGYLRTADYLDEEIAAEIKSDTNAIRSAIPRTETVEWPGGSVETDNVWLHEDIDLFLAEPNISKRDAIIDRIDQRLQAVEAKLVELSNAVAAGPTKDEEKRKLAEILKRQEYQKPAAAEESLFQRWRREFLEWLAKMFPRANIQPGEMSGIGSLGTVFQILLYALLIAAIGYVIYRILPFVSGRFARKAKSTKNERVILGETIGDDRSAGDLFAEAEELARSGELRLAIRKGYVALLCELADRKVIGLARHKTNRDYLRDVRSKRELFENLRSVTGQFEDHWYGSQRSDQQAWEDFREYYLRTVRGI